MGFRKLEINPEEWCSLQWRLYPFLEPIEKIVGKKVSFEINTDAIEGPTHRIELALRQTPEDNLGSDTPTKFDSAKGLQDKLNSFRRLTRGERNRVEMAQSPRQAKVLKNWAERAKAPTLCQSIPKKGRMTKYHRNPTLGARHLLGLLTVVPELPINLQRWSKDLNCHAMSWYGTKRIWKHDLVLHGLKPYH